MKAITAVCANGASVSVPPIANGRISRHSRDGENDEIQMYLSKLKDLVPNMPKNKKLSKLEVIQNVIDYICDLQRALETTSNSSAISNFDANTVLNGSLSPRQPLGVRSSPNTILVTNISSDTNTVTEKPSEDRST
jgi:DNA-binding protein inhibitor ID